MFRKEMSKKTQNGGENINSGGVLQHWAHLGPSGSFNSCSPGQACCFWRKPSTRLGELSGKLLPYFGYKRVWKAEGKGFNTLGKHISLKISEKKEKEEENQGRGASVMLLWSIPWTFFTVLHSFFVLHPVSACFKDLNLIYGPLGVPFILCASSSPYSVISDLFLCLKQVSTDRSCHNLV